MNNYQSFAEDILATLREPFLVLDKNLRVQIANNAFYTCFCVTKEDTENQLVYDLGNRQWNIPQLRILLEDVLPKNTIFNDFEVEHEFPTIGKKTMLLNARHICRDGNHTETILLAIEDVTLRRKIEQDRHNVETRFTSMVKNIKDHAIFMLDEAGVITSWNVEAENIFGYDESEIIGQNFSIIFSPNDIKNKKPEQELDIAKKEGKAEDECWHVRKNGKSLWGLGILTSTHDANGMCIGFVKILRDMTNRKLWQEQIEEQLSQKMKNMSKADTRKDEFLAMLSHELRNPLAPIMNAVQILSLQQLNENNLQKKARVIVERQTGYLKVIVDDLLEVSRITTGRINLHKDKINIKTVVERAIESVQPLIDQNKHEIITSIPIKPIWLYADPTRISQILVNLLTNAAKYMKTAGHIKLVINQEENKVIIRIIDTGVGIAPNLLPSIFDLFMQAEQSLARSNGGLGIGLTVVKKLVEMHDGIIKVYSVVGQGSEFVVELPTMTIPNSEKDAAVQPKILKVLVVDDNVDTAESMALLVESEGHEVKMAHDGPSTLPIAISFKPDVVLLDIGLPGITGFDVAKQLRQQESLQKIMLVAVTGYGQESDRQQSKESGFDHHLTKPIEFSVIKEILTSVSEKRNDT